MRVVFLTPMKPPDSPVPSGDRTFARLIIRALEHAGHTVIQPSRFTTWSARPEDFAAIRSAFAGELARVVAALEGGPPIDAVLTYHNYHKAPDLLGPALSARFAVPHAIIEASRAPRRADGPWAAGFRAADDALFAADAVAAVTRWDCAALLEAIPEKVVRLAPFLDTAPFAGPHHGAGGTRLVSAVMMRPGRKADSVRVLAEVAAKIHAVRPDVTLTIAGDGPAREPLEPLFAPGTMVGRLDEDYLAALFAAADVFIWPAVDEPFGFVFLEAQAAGLPVVGGAARGVVDVVDDGRTGHLVPPTDAAALAEAALGLLAAPGRRRAMGDAARAFMANNDLQAGAARIDDLLTRAAKRHRRGECGRVAVERAG